MFTLEQLKMANSKVKTGADFPAYVQDIKALGVTHYATFVADGNSYYYGADHHQVPTGARYAVLAVAESPHVEQFKASLQAHQQGATDFPTFCEDCAKSGIEKWVIYLDEMTCTYYDRAGGGEVLVEVIAQGL